MKMCLISHCEPKPLFPLQTSCSSLDAYLRGPLNQYLLNVSTAAELCSQTLCGSRGRCQRKNPDSNVYLHLDPLSHSISRPGGKLTVIGELGEAEKKSFLMEFQCQCYSGYQGVGCSQIDPVHQRSMAAETAASALPCVVSLIISILL